MNDYAKQYKTIKFLMETIFPVSDPTVLSMVHYYSILYLSQILNQSLLEASEMNYIAGDPFPDKQENREGKATFKRDYYFSV